MDASIWFESWREKIKRNLPREPILCKALVMLGGLLTLAATLSVGTFQMKQWNNVLFIQKNFNNTVTYNNTYWENSTYYDIMWVNGSFVDDDAALDLKLKINETCDIDCQKRGCNWSTIYALSGFVLVLSAVNALVLVVGAFFYKSRMIGMFCHAFLTVMSAISIGVLFKFRNWD